MIDPHHPNPADQGGYLRGGEAYHQLRLAQKRLLGADDLVLFRAVPEPVMDRLDLVERGGFRYLVRGVAAARRKGDGDRHARVRGGPFAPDIPSQNNHFGEAGLGALRDRLQHRQGTGQSLRLVAAPVLLGGKPDAVDDENFSLDGSANEGEDQPTEPHYDVDGPGF